MVAEPRYKPTEAGLIPDDWQAVPLLKAVRIATGQVSPLVAPYRSMPLVGPDHVEGGTGRLLRIETAAEQRAISGKHLFRKGDIIYAKIRPHLRKVMLAAFDGLCSADMYPLTPAPDVVGGFIHAVMLGHRFSVFAESVSARSGMPKINRSELSQYTFALPVREQEQAAIAGALHDVDRLLAGLDRLIAKKRDLKQAAMQQLLTGQARLPGFHVEWEERRVDEMGDVLAGKALAALAPGPVRPYLRTKNVLDGHIDVGDVLEMPMTDSEFDRFRVLEGDVLLNEGQSLELVGRCSMYRNEFPGPCAMQNQLLRFRSREGTAPGFAEQLFRRCQHTGTFASIATQTTSVAHLGSKRFSSLRLRWPSDVTEQASIAEVLSDMDAELAALEARREKTRGLKQAMMQELLTGRIRLV